MRLSRWTQLSRANSVDSMGPFGDMGTVRVHGTRGIHVVR